jgi:hypothetical protein
MRDQVGGLKNPTAGLKESVVHVGGHEHCFVVWFQ